MKTYKTIPGHICIRHYRSVPFSNSAGGWTIITIEQEVTFSEFDLFFNDQLGISSDDEQILFDLITKQFSGNRDWIMTMLRKDCEYDVIAFEVINPDFYGDRPA